MNEDEIKKHIRNWIKSVGRIDCGLGEIAIEKEIAEGGTALVFAATFGGKGAAIKFLTEAVSVQSERYKRFLREYVNLVRLVPTGVVVPLYHFAVQNLDVPDQGASLHVPYIVMECCELTLDTQYKQNRLTDADTFRKLLDRLLTSLEVIHDAGIVHRDIKPKNILQRQNGDWVLGDFGISWFDPEFYGRLEQTKPGDRLANWGFSAPEQFRRDAYEDATPRLDLFALGQTLYYCVSGQTISGTSYPNFAKLAPQLKRYDPLIDKLVRQEPSERFQSVSEVRQFLTKHEQDTQFDRDAALAQEMIKQVKEFDLRLRRSVPGSSRYHQAQGEREIGRVLASLADGCDGYELWWAHGLDAWSASPMKELSPGIWLIGCFECEVVDLWVCRNPTLDRQCVVLHLAPRPPFGFLDLEGREIDEAGYFEGVYVDPNALYDGYAEIDGKIVSIAEDEWRWRNLRDDFLILAPQLSVCIQDKTRIDAFYRSLIGAEKISQPLLAQLKDLPREDWMRLFD